MVSSEKLKSIRIRLSMTQTKFAKTLKVAQSNISCWENGVTTPNEVTLARLKKLCEKHNIKVSWGK